MSGVPIFRSSSKRLTGRLPLTVTFVIAMLTVCAPHAIGAPECPLARQPRIPKAADAIVNLDTLKDQLRKYHDGDYNDDIALVLADARAYVERRANEIKPADKIKKLAVVLDIDETSLSNWPNIKADDFGFIRGGPCLEEPDLACGFDDWIHKASAPAIKPTLDFFNAAIAKNIAVFFITGRRDNQREATLWNLDRAGFQGWAKLITRPNEDLNPSLVPFKSGERKKIEQSGYSIIANIGDQQSDLEGGFAECRFKLPDPFYFIP